MEGDRWRMRRPEGRGDTGQQLGTTVEHTGSRGEGQLGRRKTKQKERGENLPEKQAVAAVASGRRVAAWGGEVGEGEGVG